MLWGWLKMVNFIDGETYYLDSEEMEEAGPPVLWARPQGTSLPLSTH